MKFIPTLLCLLGGAVLMLSGGCAVFTPQPDISEELQLPGTIAIFPAPGTFELQQGQNVLRLTAGSRTMLYNGIRIILPESPDFDKEENRFSLSRDSIYSTLLPLLDHDFAAPGRVRTVMLDPGHGGSDPGAQRSMLPEKDLNLRIALLLKQELERRGFKVIMTRNDDRYLSLDQRLQLTAESGADIFVSIHHNAAANPGAAGYEIYVPPPGKPNYAASLRLAADIQSHIISDMTVIDRGVKSANFKVLRTQLPAVLIEAGFISNPAEEKAVNSSGRQQAAAAAVATGIAGFAAAGNDSSRQERQK